MKPFNLELAKQGKPVCTRDGRDVEILKFDLKNNSHPLIVVIENEEILLARETGLHDYHRKPSDYDLMMKSEKKEGWVNLYKHGNRVATYADVVYETEQFAKNFASRNSGLEYITTVKIEWEE